MCSSLSQLHYCCIYFISILCKHFVLDLITRFEILKYFSLSENGGVKVTKISFQFIFRKYHDTYVATVLFPLLGSGKLILV